MLIEFTVSNFRSIRDELTLSMVAQGKHGELPQNLLPHKDLPGLKGLRFLKSAVIYGANASGKSNIVMALRFMQWKVLKSATKLGPGEDTGAIPFLLDTKFADQPSRFECTFLQDNVRYQYGFALDRKRICEEWLFSYPEGSPRRLFERSCSHKLVSSSVVDLHKEYRFGKHFGAGKTFQQQTRNDALLVSVGAQFNHETLTNVYNWFATGLNFLDLSAEGTGISPTITASQLLKVPHLGSQISEMLRVADLGISRVEVVEHKISPEEVQEIEDVPDGSLRKMMAAAAAGEISSLDVGMYHATSDERGQIKFNINEESGGTQRFFHLLGPFERMMTDGFAMIIDEIEVSLHSLLSKELIRSVHDSKDVESSAQLIFTTHDTTLLDTKLFRRDQIFFTEKDSDGGTHLTSLSDFKVRKGEAIQKGYLAGRYGAIPMLDGSLVL